MSLFRRKPREASEAPEPAKAPAPTARPAKAPPAEPVAPSGAPPPHPQPAPPATTASAARFLQCFVCDSTLDAGKCPKCRITWVE